MANCRANDNQCPRMYFGMARFSRSTNRPGTLSRFRRCLQCQHWLYAVTSHQRFCDENCRKNMQCKARRSKRSEEFICEINTDHSRRNGKSSLNGKDQGTQERPGLGIMSIFKRGNGALGDPHLTLGKRCSMRGFNLTRCSRIALPCALLDVLAIEQKVIPVDDTMLTRLGESVWTRLRSCESPGIAALSFRSDTSTRHPKPLSEHSSDFNSQVRDRKLKQNDSYPLHYPAC